MNTEKTTNGITYTEAIASSEGASFILFPDKNHTLEMLAVAVKEIKQSRDVVSIRIATEEDRDEQYRTEIFINPATHTLRWYEINADDHKLLRKERKKGTTTDAYIEKYVLPCVEETRERNHKKYGDDIFKI